MPVSQEKFSKLHTRQSNKSSRFSLNRLGMLHKLTKPINQESYQHHSDRTHVEYKVTAPLYNTTACL